MSCYENTKGKYMSEENNVGLGSTLLRYGIDIGFLMSGFFGALLLALKTKGQSISTTLAVVLAGTACANYLTPLVLKILPEFLREDTKYGVAFVMGFAGLKGLELIINKITKYSNAKKIKIDIRM